MKKNNAKRTVVVIALIALMAIPSMFAFFTDTDSKTNVFTVGSVDIKVVETEWDSNGEEELLVVPGREVTKDPNVTNDGESSAYVFVRVKDGANFYKWEKADNWTKLTTEENVYYYDEPLAGGATTTNSLFKDDVVTFPTDWTVDDGTKVDDFNIEVVAYAIQSEDFANAEAAWAAAPDAWKL